MVVIGWGGLEEVEVDDNFLFVNYVFFDKLFLWVKVVVYYCSVGIFGRILYFGKLMLNVLFLFDMLWFGVCGYEMGVLLKFILV